MQQEGGNIYGHLFHFAGSISSKLANACHFGCIIQQRPVVCTKTHLGGNVALVSLALFGFSRRPYGADAHCDTGMYLCVICHIAADIVKISEHYTSCNSQSANLLFALRVFHNVSNVPVHRSPINPGPDNSGLFIMQFYQL